MEGINFQCQVGEACVHWNKDAKGGCMSDPEIHVYEAHESGHFAEALCLTFKENIEAEVGDMVAIGTLEKWNGEEGRTN